MRRKPIPKWSSLDQTCSDYEGLDAYPHDQFRAYSTKAKVQNSSDGNNFSEQQKQACVRSKICQV